MIKNEDNNKNHEPNTITKERAQAILTFINDQYNRSLSHHWFYLAIIIGVFGNLFTSTLLEFIKTRYVNYLMIIDLIGIISFIIVLLSTIRAHYDYKKEQVKHKKMLELFPLNKIIEIAYPKENE